MPDAGSIEGAPRTLGRQVDYRQGYFAELRRARYRGRGVLLLNPGDEVIIDALCESIAAGESTYRTPASRSRLAAARIERRGWVQRPWLVRLGLVGLITAMSGVAVLTFTDARGYAERCVRIPPRAHPLHVTDSALYSGLDPRDVCVPHDQLRLDSGPFFGPGTTALEISNGYYEEVYLPSVLPGYYY